MLAGDKPTISLLPLAFNIKEKQGDIQQQKKITQKF